MLKTWRYKEADVQAQKVLTEKTGVSDIIAHLLTTRGITEPDTAASFLNPDLSGLHDPYLLKDMDRGVQRLKKAVKNKEKILIFGDYDVDGITATALSVLVLRRIDARVSWYIPNRLEEGYGLNKEALDKIKQRQPALVLTVDCGISSSQEVEGLKSVGIDTIITDHHHPSGPIPLASAVINPRQPDCSYPNKDLAGVGVVFKLWQALLGQTVLKGLKPYLDLVCLGTIADVVALKGENRILVKEGLNQLQQTRNKGLQALINTAGLKNKQIDTYHIGYIIGPRINASGRLGSPEKSLRLLLTDSGPEAYELAADLEKGNRDRQKIEAQTLEEALNQVEGTFDFKNKQVIVLARPDWHPGVIGIVASRIVERYYRPAILITIEKNKGRGSGRSIPGFHLFDAVSVCADLLETFGGHEYAIGLSIKPEAIDAFTEKINQTAARVIKPEDLLPCLNIDMELPLAMVNDKLVEDIEILAPFGLGNPRPVFSTGNLNLKGRPVFLKKNGVKFFVSSADSSAHQAITFDLGEHHSIPPKMGLVYNLVFNTFKGKKNIQLRLKDIKSS